MKKVGRKKSRRRHRKHIGEFDLPVEKMEKLENVVRDVVETMGFDFVDMEIVGSARKRILRVVIYSPSGIGINDCQKVSEVLSRRLDVEDPFPESYVLEVSSPGVDRVLKSANEFNIFKGRDVVVQILNGDDYELPETFKAVLLGIEGDVVKFNYEGKNVWVEFEDVKSVRLYFSFREALSK